MKNQVDNSISNSNSNIHLTKKYSRHNDEDIDTDSKNAKIIDNTSIKKVLRDIDVHQEIDKQPIVRGDNVIDLFNKLIESSRSLIIVFSSVIPVSFLHNMSPTDCILSCLLPLFAMYNIFMENRNAPYS